MFQPRIKTVGLENLDHKATNGHGYLRPRDSTHFFILAGFPHGGWLGNFTGFPFAGFARDARAGELGRDEVAGVDIAELELAVDGVEPSPQPLTITPPITMLTGTAKM